MHIKSSNNILKHPCLYSPTQKYVNKNDKFKNMRMKYVFNILI